jgi:hypothetical protein
MASYIHPSSGAEVHDVVCPKGHSGGKGHVAAGQLGKATCGHVLKSHKTTGPEETVDGKKVRPVITHIDLACTEILVAAADPKGTKAAKAAAGEAAASAKTKAKTGKKDAKPTAKHPQAGG